MRATARRPWGKTLTAAAVACLMQVSFLATANLAAPGDVLHSYESPTAYPMGLANKDDSLFVIDWRYAVIHEINRADGSAIRTFDAPTLHPHGLTYGGGLLWVGDDYDGKICGMNIETGIVETTFNAPERRVTGLAWMDDTLLILAAGQIYRVLPDDGTILAYYDAPTRTSGSLCYDGTYLWVSDRIKDEIYMIRPSDGKVIGIIDAPANHATGLTWADGELWNVDFESRKIYKLETNGEETYALVDPMRRRVDYLWEMVNYGSGDVLDLKVAVAVPEQAPRQKILAGPDFTPQPTRIETDNWGQPCAVYEIPRLGAGEKVTIGYTIEVELRTTKHFVRPERVGTLDDIPAEIRERYTVDASRYRISDPYIHDLAREIVGDETNVYWMARLIYDYVIENVTYELVGGWDVPEVVLRRGTGSCSEYAFAYIALCRAVGVPAMYQGSIAERGDAASIDRTFHRWTKVYLPAYGWIPVDPSAGVREEPAEQARFFGHLRNRYLITTNSGGESEHLAWSYNAYSNHKTQGHAHVVRGHYGFWAPLDEDERESIADPGDTSMCVTLP